MNYKNSRYAYFNLETYLIGIIILLFISFRIFKYFESELFVIWFDSAQYASVSLASVWSEDFWSDGIPPLYPFFLKYFHQLSIGSTLSEINIFSLYSFQPTITKGLEKLPDYPYYLVKDNFDIITASILQLFFSIFSWVFFSLSFGNIFKNSHIKFTSILLILFLGSESSVILWDKHILTESISISLSLLSLSLLIHIKKYINNNLYVILFSILLIFVSFIKITNNYFLIMLLPLISFYYIRHGLRNTLQYAVIISVILSLFIFNQFMLFKGDRTHVPMKDIISSRISTDGFEEIYSYFKNAGMPHISEELIGKSWTAPFEDYPELNSWWLTKSSRTYQKFLITHPTYFFFKPFQYTNPTNKPVYSFLTPDIHHYEQVAPVKLQIIISDAYLWFSAIVLLFLFLYAFIKNKNIYRDEIILPVFLLLNSTALSLIIWHADHGELDRHLIQCAIMIRIGLLMLLVSLANIFFLKKSTNN